MVDNINLGGDKLGLCSTTGKMLGESSHTSSCSETDIMFGRDSHTSSCSETDIFGGHSHTSSCSETGKMDGEHSHTSICSEAGIMGEENYHTCGGCGQTFDHICKLHQHLIGHCSGGSYHYDNHIRTAFPKYDMVCKEMQTEEFNIPLASKRRKRTGLLDNYDIPSLKKVGRVLKKSPRHKARVSSNENDHSNANKRVETEIRRSKRNKKEASQTRITINVGNLCSKKSTNLDPGQFYETDEETIDYIYSVDGNTSTEKNDRIKVELEDICGYKEDDDDDNGNYTVSIGQNFENTVKDINSEDEENTVNTVKIESVVIEENDGNEGTCINNHKVNAIIKHDTWEELGRNTSKRIKCNVEKVANSLKPKRKEIDVPVFQCKICCEVFDKKHKMQKHIKEIHRKDFPFICITCSATFGSKDDFRSHRKKEHPGPTHPCGLCDKVLASKRSLDAHHRIHMGIRPFSCDICIPKREFTRNGELIQHMQSTHSTEKKWLCDYCGKAFSAKYVMVNHAKNCGGLKPHKCEDCDMKFVSNFGLQRHRRVHTGEKPYVCEVCGFACSIPTHLRMHMRTHTGEKPYSCPHCPKSFRILQEQKRHLVTHTKVKAFVCSYCSKAFTARSSLRTHVRQHTGETPYKCATCGMGFRQNVSLKTHIKSHHQLIASQQESTVPRQETMAASAIQRIVWNPNDYT